MTAPSIPSDIPSFWTRLDAWRARALGRAPKEPWRPNTIGVVAIAPSRQGLSVQMDWNAFWAHPDRSALVPPGLVEDGMASAIAHWHSAASWTHKRTHHSIDRAIRRAHRRGANPCLVHNQQSTVVSPALAGLAAFRTLWDQLESTEPGTVTSVTETAVQALARLDRMASITAALWITIAVLVAEGARPSEADRHAIAVECESAAVFSRIFGDCMRPGDAGGADGAAALKRICDTLRTLSGAGVNVQGGLDLQSASWAALSQPPPVVRAVLDAADLSGVVGTGPQPPPARPAPCPPIGPRRRM